MTIKIHPRFWRTEEAELAVQNAVAHALRDYDLTTSEQVQVVHSAYHAWMASTIRGCLRAERHPDSPDKGADES